MSGAFTPQPWRGFRRDSLLAELAALEYWLADTADLLELAADTFPRLADELRPVVALVRSRANAIADDLERLTLDGDLASQARSAGARDRVAR